LYGYTNESDEIPNEIIKDMAEGLEATEWRDSYIENYDIEEQEFKDLTRMFRLHADAGHYLLAWYWGDKALPIPETGTAQNLY